MRWLDALGVGSVWVSLIFNLVAVGITLPFLGLRGLRRDVMPHLMTGFLLGTAFTLYTVALLLTDVLHAILLFYLTPVWSTLAAWLIFRERLSPARILAIAGGFLGMAFILGAKTGIPLPRNGGDLMALISGILWALGTMRSYSRPAPGTALPVFAFSFGGLVSSAVILLIALPFATPITAAGGVLPNLLGIVLLSMIIFVPPNFLVLWAAQRIDSGRVGILLMTEVLVGSLTAALFSGEPFGAAELLGTAFIVGAGLVEVLGRSSAR